MFKNFCPASLQVPKKFPMISIITLLDALDILPATFRKFSAMLTTQQQKAYQFIRQFILRNGQAPLLPEIAQGLGIRSKSHASRYVQALVEQGLLEFVPGRHRGIRLINSDKEEREFWHLPLLGKIAAGRPIEATSDTQTVDLPALLAGPQRYILQVKGDSMIEEGIYDGDWVICEYADTAPDGAIVVALIDNYEATLKRLKRNRNNTVTLSPANSQLKPMIYEAHRVKVQGIFIGLVRLQTFKKKAGNYLNEPQNKLRAITHQR